ncbi:PadR family transcriptional regulator [bacterium]|nr:MAG: PadR family transcriptional regulator [bacterium]
MSRDLSRGDVPTLILTVLADGNCHGYAIAREIERKSGQLFQMREGALYPALRVLEQDSFVEGQWEVQPSGPARKVYVLTKAGHEELARRKAEWNTYVETFNRVLGGPNVQTT